MRLRSDLVLWLRAGNVGSGKPWSWAPQLGHYWRTGPDLGTKWEGRVVAQVWRNGRCFSSKHPRLLRMAVLDSSFVELALRLLLSCSYLLDTGC